MLSRKIGLNHILKQLNESRVLMRADLNVPLKDGQVKDPTRIIETIPSIQKILQQKPKGLVIMSHLGRPDGQVKPEFSLKPCVPILEDLLKQKVRFIDDCVGTEALDASFNLKNQEIILLENLRYYIEEEGSVKNSEGIKIKADKNKIDLFRSKLNLLGSILLQLDIYVNDAFGTAHRAHSSIVGVTCPIRAAGDLLKKELEYFSKALETPQKPFLVILGGAKVSDKIPLINNLLDKVDEMIIGGAMAFTFLHIQGVPIGKSLLDKASIPICQEILAKAAKKNVKLHFPVDFVCAQSMTAPFNVSSSKSIGADLMGLDHGPETTSKFDKIISNAKTIVWNGPMGVFEIDEFAKGSLGLLSSVCQSKGITIAGGGDTLNLLKKVKGSKEKITHVSTGGGASLELLEGKILPGVAHLTDIDQLQ